MRALRTELTRTMLRRYYSYISAGKTPGEAYDAVLGYAQEMKDRIADAMRSVHTTHTAPPFGGTGRTTRNYGAQSHNADAGAQHREDTQDPRRTRPQEKSNTPGHSRKARSEKPAKKAVSISTALVLALVGAALVAAAGCGIFFITQAVFSHPRTASSVETPVKDPDSAAISEYSTDKASEPDGDTTLTLGDAARQYRDMTQNFSEDGAYAIDAAHLAQAEVLEVHWPAGNIKVHVYDGTDFLVLESSDGGITREQALCCGLEGNTLFVQYCAPEAAQSTLPVKNLEICIPQTLAEAALVGSFTIYDAALTLDGLTLSSAQIRAAGGPIDGQNLTVSGPVSIETVSSDAHLSGLLENISFSSQSGSLYADSSDTLCTIEAQTQTGNVETTANIHRLQISTQSGDVRIYAPICPYALDISTQDGSVFLHLPTQSDFTLRFRSDSGSLISGLSVVASRDTYIRGDGIADFAVETGSGDLQIFAYVPAL